MAAVRPAGPEPMIKTLWSRGSLIALGVAFVEPPVQAARTPGKAFERSSRPWPSGAQTLMRTNSGARSPARLAPKRAPSSSAACPERSKATLPTNSGAREAQHASRLSARQAVQPHARKYVELSDFGTIRSRSTNEMEAHENRPNGRLHVLSNARSAQRPPAERAQT